MKIFTDALNREWTINVNVGTAKKIKAAHSVDIFGIYKEEVERIFGDPALLVGILYTLTEDQCEKKGISPESFAEGMRGDGLEAGQNALLEDVADFFPSSRKKILLATKAKAEEFAAKMEAKAMTTLDELAFETFERLMKSRGQSG